MPEPRLTDPLVTLEADSRKPGTRGGALAFGLPLDGQQARREQGMAIDAAYRSFETATRRFIGADPPGQEQLTRHLFAGA